MPSNDFSTGVYEQDQYKKKALMSQMDGGAPPAATTQPVGDPYAPPTQEKGSPEGGGGGYTGPAQGTGGPVDPFKGFDEKGGVQGGVAPGAPTGGFLPAGQKPDIPAPGPGVPTTTVPPNQPGTGTGGYTGPEHTGGPIDSTGQPIPAPGEKPAPPSTPPPSGPGNTPPVYPGPLPPSQVGNQDQQKYYRDALLRQLGQGTGVDPNDPNIKQQLDPYAAAMERARREEVQRGAESAFASGQDFGSPEQLAAAERAGQATGLRHSELVGEEIKAKRTEIESALSKFGDQMSQDQKDGLTKQLAELDAQLKREGYGVTKEEGAAERASKEAIAAQENETKLKALDSESGWRTYIADLEAKSKAQALAEGGRQADQQAVLERYKTDKTFDMSKYQTDRGFDMDKLRLDADTMIRQLGLTQTGTLANRELDIRDKLGMAGLNAEMTRMLLQDRQFRDRLGFDISAWQADQNRLALLQQMPQ